MFGIIYAIAVGVVSATGAIKDGVTDIYNRSHKRVSGTNLYFVCAVR